MKLQYALNEKDFLDFLLYNASKSQLIKIKKRNTWMFLTIGAAAIGIYFLFQEDFINAALFGIAALAFGIIYPIVFKWNLKKSYAKYNRENLSDRFGALETLELHEDHIFCVNPTGEGKVTLDEIEGIDETAEYFFVKHQSGSSLIIPKDRIENTDALRKKFEAMGFAINDETDWKS